MTKITNHGPGPRWVNTETGQVVLQPGETRDDLKLSKGEAANLHPDFGTTGDSGAPGTGAAGSSTSDAHPQTDEDPDAPKAVKVAHEGLGNWYAYDAQGERIGGPLKKAEAREYASANGLQFEDNA